MKKSWFAEWGKAVVTLALAAIGYAAQWGAVNAKLDQMIAEVRAMKVVELDLAQRVSRIEGRQGNGLNNHPTGGRGDGGADRRANQSADRGSPAS